MNLIKNFENRVSDAFGTSPHGYTAPFSFKRLAKEAAKQMEAETFIIDGVDTAPALYTILVSAADDATMRVLYPQITAEIVSLVSTEAQYKGYEFVGEPLARFLVDPKLRSGKFAVFAENVDAQTLERLREEEKAFLLGSSVVGGAAADREAAKQAQRKPRRRIGFGAKDNASNRDELAAPTQKPAPRRATRRRGNNQPSEADSSLRPIATPAAAAAGAAAGAAAAGAAAGAFDVVTPPIATPMMRPSPISLDDSASMGLDVMPPDYLDSNVQASQLAVPTIDVPMTQRKNDPVSAPPQESAINDEGSEPVTCLLVDRQSGYTYPGTAPRTVIGRERVAGNIILHDPNVSRRHAELTFDGNVWTLRDLGSTNGTQVNDVEITKCVLHDGDLLTIGLMNLEFREV